MITFSMQIKKISSLFTHLELKLIKRALQGLWRDIFSSLYVGSDTDIQK